jgi:hypothetical protein
MQWIRVSFTPNLYDRLERAAVSTTIFAMFAVRNTSDFGLERDECAVRQPIPMSATKRVKFPHIVPCFPCKYASYSPKSRRDGIHLHEYVLHSEVRGLRALFQYYEGLVPTCILGICRNSCIVKLRVIISTRFPLLTAPKRLARPTQSECRRINRG